MQVGDVHLQHPRTGSPVMLGLLQRLANGGTLDAKYRDHDLTGNYKGTRECHIEPDWLLIYEICGDVLVLMLYRLGSHSELFKK